MDRFKMSSAPTDPGSGAALCRFSVPEQSEERSAQLCVPRGRSAPLNRPLPVVLPGDIVTATRGDTTNPLNPQLEPPGEPAAVPTETAALSSSPNQEEGSPEEEEEEEEEFLNVVLCL